MKKIYAFILAVAMMVAVSCGGNTTNRQADPVADTTEVVEVVDTLNVEGVEATCPDCGCEVETPVE